MIAYLRVADFNPSILNKKIKYIEKVDANKVEEFKPSKYIESGKSYSVDELIKYMIIYSDNNATNLLQANVDEKALVTVYSDLGIPASDTLEQENVTPKTYSYIFRILYNATYLSKSMSQYALEILAQTQFEKGIKMGLPENMTSSQKFGERTVMNRNITTGEDSLSFRELHDCGIVYYPENPYILCVMTKGDDFEKLSKIISDISLMVYSESKSGVLKI